MQNTGTKTWRHVRLHVIHQAGYAPLQNEVDVPEVAPGDCVDVTVAYPPASQDGPDEIKRSATQYMCMHASSMYMYMDLLQ